MRLFIAILLSDEIKEGLLKTIQELKGRSAKGRFTHRENLHLTLVFIGETNNLEAIKQAMERVELPPFTIALDGLGEFRRNGGDIYWVGVKRNDSLLKIYQQLVTELIKTGFSIEEREYHPHLTLGREIALRDKEAVFVPNGSMRVGKISLMKSERIDGRLTYTELYEKKLD